MILHYNNNFILTNFTLNYIKIYVVNFNFDCS